MASIVFAETFTTLTPVLHTQSNSFNKTGSGSATPPRSPLKSATHGGSTFQQQQQQQYSEGGGAAAAARRPKVAPNLKGTLSAPCDGVVVSSSSGAGAPGSLKCLGRYTSQQQQLPMQPAGSVAADDSSFVSFDSSRTAAAGAGADSSLHSAAVSSSSSSQQTAFQQQPPSSSLSAAGATAAGAVAGDDEEEDSAAAAAASSSALSPPPYTEAELEAMIGGTLRRQYWEPIHDGVGSVRDVYSIRGPNYLRDRKKIPAGW